MRNLPVNSVFTQLSGEITNLANAWLKVYDPLEIASRKINKDAALSLEETIAGTFAKLAPKQKQQALSVLNGDLEKLSAIKRSGVSDQVVNAVGMLKQSLNYFIEKCAVIALLVKATLWNTSKSPENSQTSI